MAKRILVIDDEMDILEILTFRLGVKGYEVFSAKDGKEGVAIAKVKTPDLILLDLRLPDLYGCEILKEIRAEQALERVSIILITASVEDIEKKTKECGASDYLLKPIEVTDLYAMVEKYIGSP